MLLMEKTVVCSWTWCFYTPKNKPFFALEDLDETETEAELKEVGENFELNQLGCVYEKNAIITADIYGDA